jgi:hypothetical protein
MSVEEQKQIALKTSAALAEFISTSLAETVTSGSEDELANGRSRPCSSRASVSALTLRRLVYAAGRATL